MFYCMVSNCPGTESVEVGKSNACNSHHNNILKSANEHCLGIESEEVEKSDACNEHHNNILKNATEDCPGTESEEAGKSNPCKGCPNQEACASAAEGLDSVTIEQRMTTVKHKILVLSGKGGVGKSTFSTQLSYALAAMDFEVGILDVDICGPSIPKMMGLEGQGIHVSNSGLSPVYVDSNLGVMSIGFMLPNADEPLILRGPRKSGVIKRFLKDIHWEELDFLVVDAPPGTSDEHISLVQFLQETGIDGAIIVTSPQQVSLIDVRKAVSFCNEVGVQVLGVVENMNGLCISLPEIKFTTTTDIGEQKDISGSIIAEGYNRKNVFAYIEMFDSSAGGAAQMCREMSVPFLGKVPFDLHLGIAAEEGRSCFTDAKCTASASALKLVIDKLLMAQQIVTKMEHGGA